MIIIEMLQSGGKIWGGMILGAIWGGSHGHPVWGFIAGGLLGLSYTKIE